MVAASVRVPVSFGLCFVKMILQLLVWERVSVSGWVLSSVGTVVGWHVEGAVGLAVSEQPWSTRVAAWFVERKRQGAVEVLPPARREFVLNL